MDIDTIIAEIAELCETEGLHVYEDMPEVSSLILPAIVLGWPDNIQYNMDFKGGCELTFTVMVLAPTASLSDGQRTINQLLSWPGGLAQKLQVAGTPSNPRPWKGVSVSEATVVGTDIFTSTSQRYLLANLLIIVNT